MGMLQVTIQSALMSGTSNLVAQAITAYRNNGPYVIDWVPVYQFILFTLISTPPNYLWQDFLETFFPASTVTPTSAAVASASEASSPTTGNDKASAALDEIEEKEGTLVEQKLNVRNTVIKTVLDQTVGAAVNTFLFVSFIYTVQAAMSPRPAEFAKPEASIDYLFRSGKAVDLDRVNWDAVWAQVREEFLPILISGWTFWPFVSIINFALVKTVETRNLVGGAAGMLWGIYISMFTVN